jgi:hypothetical protein
MIAISDLHPDGLRFEGLSEAEVTALISATAEIVAADRVTRGPGFVAFDHLNPDEAARITAAFRRLQGG